MGCTRQNGMGFWEAPCREEGRAPHDLPTKSYCSPKQGAVQPGRQPPASERGTGRRKEAWGQGDGEPGGMPRPFPARVPAPSCPAQCTRPGCIPGSPSPPGPAPPLVRCSPYSRRRGSSGPGRAASSPPPPPLPSSRPRSETGGFGFQPAEPRCAPPATSTRTRAGRRPSNFAALALLLRAARAAPPAPAPRTAQPRPPALAP
jgi:hypothetical protein